MPELCDIASQRWIYRAMRHEKTIKEWKAVLLADPCVYCGAKPDGLDHIVPSSRRGSDAWTNRAPACRECDQIKGNTGLVVFLLAEGFARKKVERRQYEHRYARQSAIDSLRQKIATEFYKGNIRFTDGGRLKFIVKAATA